jgi:urea transport system permease protein
LNAALPARPNLSFLFQQETIIMEWLSEFGAIAAMQGFNGLSVFCVLLLMALGLAIIFGQMGVINMAHGEFLTIGAYTTYVVSILTEQYAPFFGPYYFFLAIVLSFFIAGAIGWLVEWAMISKLYQRPLDTLLATWGLSLVMQQAFRSIFGAREVSATLPDWLMGSWNPTEAIDIPRNGLFVMGLTFLMTSMIFVMLYRSRWGLQVRATVQNRVMSRAVGINTNKVDRMTFALGCGVAGVAGAAFTTIGSTGPTAGSLYIVDTFLVVVFGGASSLLGTIASAFSIAQAQSLMEFFMSGSMAKVFTLSAVILILMMRPQGLFSNKVRK